MERRLAAIVAADVVGFSKLAGAAEEETLTRVERLLSAVNERVTGRGGRIFHQAGDGVMVEFQSPVSAVRAAFDIQRDLVAQRREDPDGLQLRIGVHLADVVCRDGDLLGDGVNIAARIEAAAEPDSVTVSAAVFDQVKRNAMLTFRDLGPTELKNISEPIRLYRVVGEMDRHSCISGMVDVVVGAAQRTEKMRGNGVVVLPFTNMSGDPEQEYFADGFTEDLITELARFRDLFVVSRNASFALKGRALDLREVSASLGVAYCLEGSVRKMGPRVRITAQLIDGRSGDHVWADRHDVAIDEIFDAQDRLAASIVSMVAGRIEGSAALVAAKAKRPADLNAWDCLLRGLELHRIGGVTIENARNAWIWFDKAVQCDKQYGRAYAWRACAAATIWEWSGDEEYWNRCLADNQKGIELGPDDAECQRIAGSVAVRQRRFDAAEFHFQRALALNPNHPFILGRIGELYTFIGEPGKALEYAERAKALDPFLPEYCRELEVVACYLLGRHAEVGRVLAELPRLTLRAAAYGVASAVEGGADPAGAVGALLRIAPEFSVSEFISTEFYRDEAAAEKLAVLLRAAGLSDWRRGAPGSRQFSLGWRAVA